MPYQKRVEGLAAGDCMRRRLNSGPGAASSAATPIMNRLCAHCTRPAVSNLREIFRMIGFEVVIEVRVQEYVGRFAFPSPGLSYQRNGLIANCSIRSSKPSKRYLCPTLSFSLRIIKDFLNLSSGFVRFVIQTMHLSLSVDHFDEIETTVSILSLSHPPIDVVLVTPK
jgi:hypothetical protein